MGNEHLPKSIPMTGPFTFLSASSEFHRLNDAFGARRRIDDRVAEDVARGSYPEPSVKSDGHQQQEILTALANLEDNMFTNAVATKKELWEKVSR
jgi:hypothetical protein